MKRKICFVTIAVMVLSLIGCGSKESTDDASTQEEKQNKAKIEEAMENEDYDKAKTLTANDSNYKDLYKDLEAYLMVVNDIQMRYVHAKFDDSEDSEFEECAEKLEGIPNEYKKYSKFKAKIKLYKEELQKAISLEKKFRKKYDKLNDPYQEGKVDEYLEIANEWKEEIDKEFPATSEDSYEANLKSYLKLRVSPKGTYANYKKMLKEDVIGHTPMEFLLSASISGLLVDYLKESISVENIMVHMIGESSTGKTTGALLAVSCGSAPDFLGNNFVFSFQDTLNSLMRLIPNSYPTLIDEGSLLTDRDMTQTLYSLSSGTEKRRLSGGMEVNESSRFRTALFLTSEKSILAQCNMNTGLLTRNFEFQNVTWTSSAESADRIKSVVTENYGHIIPRVAKWLLAQDRQELVEKIVQETNAVIKRAREAKTYNNLTERTAKQSALILVAVDIVNEVLKLKLNKEAIGDFMEEHSLVNSVEQVSIGKRAMEWLLQFISKNYTQFLSKDSPKEISNCRGKLENMQTVLLNTDEESGMRLKVTDSEFMKILKEGHFSEKATVLKEWKEMGYLKAQSDRYISRVKIVGDIQVKGYIIQLPVPSNKIGGDGEKDYEEVLEERRKRINKPRQVIKDEYVEDDFFSIDDDDDLDFPEDWK